MLLDFFFVLLLYINIIIRRGEAKMTVDNSKKSGKRDDVVLIHSLFPPHSNGGKGGKSGNNGRQENKNQGGIKK